MATRIKLRYDTYANWNFSGGTLGQGELGLVDYGTHIDIHAGINATPLIWSECPVVNEGVTTLSGLTDVNLTDLSNGDILIYSNNQWVTSSGTITINGTSIAPGETKTITANTQNSLNFGTGLIDQSASPETLFDGSSNVTLSVDITSIPLNENNFWVGDSEGFPEEISSTGTGNVVRAASPTITGTLNAQNLVLSGNLIVNGTTTTINTATLTVEDKNIELGFSTDATDASADGGGITLKGTTDKTFNWVNATSSWTSSEHLNLASGKEYKINGTGVLKSDALGSGLFTGDDSRTSPQNADKLLIYHSGDWSSWITWENLKSSLEAAISGIDVDLNMPNIFSVDKDANTDGTVFNVTFVNQNANLIFAGPGTGSAAAPTFRSLVAADIPNSLITFAKIQDSAAGLSLIGRSANSAGVFAEIVANTDNTVLRRSGNSLAFGTIATDGITNSAVTFAKMQNSAAAGLSVIGRSANSAGVFAEINAGTDGHVLRRSGTTLGFGTIATAGIGDSQVTLAKIANIGANTILGNNTGSAAAPIALTAADTRTLLNVPQNLGDLLDVNISSLSEGNILVYDGTQGWINTDVIYGGNASSFV